MQRMGRIPFNILWGCVGMNLLHGSPKELSYLASREVEMLAFFSFLHGKGHIIWLLQLPCTDDHPHSTSNRTEVGKFLVHGKEY